MKKYVSVLSAMVLMLCLLAGCGGDAPESSAPVVNTCIPSNLSISSQTANTLAPMFAK